MQLCYKFLEHLSFKFNKKTVHNFFNTHSQHPSILSISDLLDVFNIENAAVRISKENFNQIDTPFIAKTHSSEGDICLITKIDKNKIILNNEELFLPYRRNHPV
jgi:ABC-type bacteriocin/lantibiotic exporter with double-glycine peptidase domain